MTTSFGFLTSIFSYLRPTTARTDDHEEEFRLLLDATPLSDPKALEAGFDILYQNPPRPDTIGEHISHLQELEIDVPYVTKKGTTLVRHTQSQIQLDGGKITIPIFKKGETYATCRNVSQYCMACFVRLLPDAFQKGKLSHKGILIAVENWIKKRVSTNGILLIAECDTNATLFVDFMELPLNVIYYSLPGDIRLERDEDGLIRFAFGRNLAPNTETTPSSRSSSATPRGRGRGMVYPNSPMPLKGVGRGRSDGLHAIKMTPHRRGAGGIKMPLHPDANSENCENGSGRNTGLIMRQSRRRAKSGKGSVASTPRTVEKRKRDSEDVDGPGAGDVSEDENASKKQKISAVTAKPIPVPSIGPPVAAPPPPPSLPPPNLSRTAPPPPPPPPGMMPGLRLPGGPPSIQVYSSGKRRVRNLHWKAIPRNKLNSTFWSQLDTVDVKGDEDVRALEEEMLDIFSLSPEKKTPREAERTPSVKRQQLSILDMKRSNNAAILLSQFKISYAEIKRAILAVDETVLTAENLISLKFMFPFTDKEKRDFANFNGDASDLGSADRFYLEMSDVPRLDEKLSFFLFKYQFKEHLEALEQSSQLLLDACKEVKDSQQFAKILKWVHTLGNVLNRDTRLCSAGFSLESLPKLAETKSRNTSVLDCLVKYIEQKNPEILFFYEELSHLDAATRSSTEIMKQHQQELNKDLNNLEAEVKAQGELAPHEDDCFIEIMTASSAAFAATKANIELSLKTFQELVTFFGEDAARITPKAFFGYIVEFSNLFRRSHKEMVERRERLERARERQQRLEALKRMQEEEEDEEDEVDEDGVDEEDEYDADDADDEGEGDESEDESEQMTEEVVEQKLNRRIEVIEDKEREELY